MSLTVARKNAPAFAWKAACERSAKFTRPEPITSRQLLPTFKAMPREAWAANPSRSRSDLKTAQAALREPGERMPYHKLREELGL